jgi:hypothetical protein
MKRLEKTKPNREGYPALDATEVNGIRSNFSEFDCAWRDEMDTLVGNTSFCSVPKGIRIWHRIHPGTHLVPGSQKDVLLIRMLPSKVGGTRAWFICPSCQDEVSKLYYRAEDWKCHTCSSLVYVSQRLAKRSRLTKKREKLSNQVGRGRPKGMHQRKYERLLRELEDVNSDLNERGGELTPNLIMQRRINVQWLLDDVYKIAPPAATSSEG